MKVRKLIEELSEQDQEAEVYFAGHTRNHCVDEVFTPNHDPFGFSPADPGTVLLDSRDG